MVKDKCCSHNCTLLISCTVWIRQPNKSEDAEGKASGQWGPQQLACPHKICLLNIIGLFTTNISDNFMLIKVKQKPHQAEISCQAENAAAGFHWESPPMRMLRKHAMVKSFICVRPSHMRVQRSLRAQVDMCELINNAGSAMVTKARVTHRGQFQSPLSDEYQHKVPVNCFSEGAQNVIQEATSKVSRLVSFYFALALCLHLLHSHFSATLWLVH